MRISRRRAGSARVRRRDMAGAGVLGLLLGAVLSLAGWPLGAQVLGPGRSLRLVETASFDIYFPPELESEALRLAGFAEEIRTRLLGELGLVGLPAEGGKRIPVLLSDEFAEMNGFFTSYPSERIVLYARPSEIDGDLGLAEDDLRLLFTHELAHALSLSERSPPWEGLAALFGDPMAPARFLAPLSFIEGAAIVAESVDASGRLADPRTGAMLRQDLLEGRAPNFWQASGALDSYPFASRYYLYGAYFSAWLRERYGPEAYATLFKELGAGRGIHDGLFAPGAFRRAFGVGLDEAWARFLAETAVERPIVTATKTLVPEPGYITALTAGRREGRSVVYWAEASTGVVLALEAGGGSPRRLCAADGHVNRLALSPDGRRLLVSTARREGEFTRLIVREWDFEAGRFRGPGLEGLREAAYAGPVDGEGNYPIIALAVEACRCDLVLVENAETRLLLRGKPDRSYASPLALGSSYYLILREGGRNLLLRLSGEQAWILAPALPLEHLRYLGAGPDALALGFAKEGELYRLALLEGPETEKPLLRCEETELSGGVQFPVPVSIRGEAEEVFYLSRRSEGEYPASYPFDNPYLSLREAKASWVALDPSFRDFVEPRDPGSASLPAPALPLLFRSYRFPSLSEDFDAAGMCFVGEDLTERLAWSLDAEYSWGAEAANLELAIGYRPSPWSLSLGLEDRFSPLGAGLYLRESSASLGIERALPCFPAWRSLNLSAFLAAGALDAVLPGAAYAGTYSAGGFAGGLGLAYSALKARYFPPFLRQGGEASLSCEAELPWASTALPALSLGTSLLGALAGPRMEVELYGSAALDGRVHFGTRRRSVDAGGETKNSILAPDYPEYLEYGDLDARGSLYAFGEARALLVSAEIQDRLFRAPLYLRRLGLKAGLRGAYLGGDLMWAAAPLFISSAFGRLELEAAPLFGSYANLGLVGGLELAYPFAPDLAGKSYRLGLSLGLRY